MVHEKLKDQSIHFNKTLFGSQSHTGPASRAAEVKKYISNSYEISKVKLHFLGGEQKEIILVGARSIFFFSMTVLTYDLLCVCIYRV